MEAIEKLFDTYSLNARVKPAFFLVFPVVISVFVWFDASRSWGGAIVTFIVSFGIISFAANQMSTKGNILQDKLFKKWEGAPTTIVLRYADERIDTFTKERYMKKLEAMIPNFKFISIEDERADPTKSDEMYRTATNFLKENTRDTKKYPLVFKELISYGFSRNITAFKTLGLLLTSTSFVMSNYLIWFNYFKGIDGKFNELIHSVPFIYVGLVVILSIFLLLWLFSINEKWVEIRAFSYAKSLLSTCEDKI